MNLKFQQVEWDDKDLMYVEFTANGQKIRWYPKWKEVDDILHCSWLTEQGYRDSHWRDYFDIMCSEVLIRGLLRRVAKTTKGACLPEVDVTASQLFRTLRNMISGEVQHATTKDD